MKYGVKQNGVLGNSSVWLEYRAMNKWLDTTLER